ncbi:9189_t:CDS:2 [Dentiscutata heterogama]|uniref:9189_t:CDS:1 n=1 Tax=Dentiscutata heterogama TaxID=1316150 RepID=A0ACA9L4M2_9GLOM|nr:9189_t:CDS:2 [Dentiscutata heterogama]
MSDNETSFTKHKPKEKVNSQSSKKPRKILTGKQKKELCQLAKDNPNFTQQELANKFGGIGRSTVAEILSQTSYWLELNEESAIAQQKPKAWKNVTEDVIIHAWQKTEILPSADLESSIEPNDDEEVELEELIMQYQNLKNPKNSELTTSISTREFIEIDNKYMTIKSVTTVQAIAGVDSILDYIEQPNANIEIDIKVFAELKRIRKELVSLSKKNSKQTRLESFFIYE